MDDTILIFLQWWWKQQDRPWYRFIDKIVWCCLQQKLATADQHKQSHLALEALGPCPYKACRPGRREFPARFRSQCSRCRDIRVASHAGNNMPIIEVVLQALIFMMIPSTCWNMFLIGLLFMVSVLSDSLTSKIAHLARSVCVLLPSCCRVQLVVQDLLCTSWVGTKLQQLCIVIEQLNQYLPTQQKYVKKCIWYRKIQDTLEVASCPSSVEACQRSHKRTIDSRLQPLCFCMWMHQACPSFQAASLSSLSIETYILKNCLFRKISLLGLIIPPIFGIPIPGIFMLFIILGKK